MRRRQSLSRRSLSPPTHLQVCNPTLTFSYGRLLIPSSLTEAPAVTRPKIKRPTSTLTTGISESTSRLSFTDDAPTPKDDDSKPFQIKKSALSRKALERAAASRAGGRPITLPLPQDAPEDKPSIYSKEYLDQLRSSTPSTPFLVVSGDDNDVPMVDQDADPLGTFSKFGTTAAATAEPPRTGNTSIPDPALVKVLKARRAAEAAKANTSTSKEFISLSRSASDSDENSDNPSHRKKPKPTRLVRTEILDEDDDPDLASFIHDPSTSTSAAHPTRLILTNALSSRKGAESEERYLRRGQIAEALALSASGSSDSDSDEAVNSDSDSAAIDHDTRHRRQLRIATGGILNADDPTASLDARLRYQPPTIPPVPDLASKLRWLGELLGEMVRIRDGTVKKVEEVRREKGEIERREREVQEGLARVGREYERLGLGGVGDVPGMEGGVGVGVGGGEVLGASVKAG